MNLAPYIAQVIEQGISAGLPVPPDAAQQLADGARQFTRDLRRGRAKGTTFSFLETELQRISGANQ